MVPGSISPISSPSPVVQLIPLFVLYSIVSAIPAIVPLPPITLGCVTMISDFVGAAGRALTIRVCASLATVVTLLPFFTIESVICSFVI